MTSAEETKRITTITSIWLNEFNNFKEHYDEIEKGYQYLAGDHYDDSQLKWYESVRRPARVFNLLFPQFNQVLGDFLLNDQKNRVYPRPGGTSRIASMFEDLLDDNNLSNDHKSTFMEYALSGTVKMGFMYPRFSNEKEIDGSLVFGHTDEFEILFDSASTDYYLDDAKYLARSKWWSREQILHHFSNHASTLRGMMVDRYDSDFWNDVNPDDMLVLNHHHVVHQAEGKYRVIEWHERKYDYADVAIDPKTGQSQIWTLHGKKADLFRQLNPGVKIISRKDEIKTITTFIPALNYLIGEKQADIQDRQFDIVPYAAYSYGKKTFRNFGIFKNAIGPQDDYNSWVNQSNALIGKTINPGHKYKPESMKNPKQVELYGSAPGVNFQLKQIADMKDIQLNEVPRYPFSAERLGGERGELMQKITGITPNMSGQSETKQENASLFAQRVKQAKVALQVMHNNFYRSKRRVDNKRIRLMQENYSTERFFLVTNPETKKTSNLLVENQIRSLNDIKTGRYRVIADDQERNPTAKDMRFVQKSEVVSTVMSMFGSLPIPPATIVIILDWWLKESDLGDIDEFVSAFAQAIQIQEAAAAQSQEQQGDAAQKQEGFSDAQQLFELVKSRLATESGFSENENRPAQQAGN